MIGLPCPKCGQTNPVDANDDFEITCCNCKAELRVCREIVLRPKPSEEEAKWSMEEILAREG